MKTGEWSVRKWMKKPGGLRFILNTGVTVVWSDEHQRYACLSCKLPDPCAHTKFVARIRETLVHTAENSPAPRPDLDASLDEVIELADLSTAPATMPVPEHLQPDSPYNEKNQAALWGPDGVYEILPGLEGARRLGPDEAREFNRRKYTGEARRMKKIYEESEAMSNDEYYGYEKKLIADAPTYEEDD